MARKYSVLVRFRTMLHRVVVGAVRLYYCKVWGMRIGKGSRISLSAKLDLTNPKGLVIGDHTAVAFRSAILTHDFVNRKHCETRIGNCCLIGAHAIVMPGVTIGDHCVIGSGAVVMRDVPPNSIVFGNPGRVIQRGIMTGAFGILLGESTLAEGASDDATQPD